MSQHYTVSQKNRTRVLWSITFTNIGQYQCHLTELFLQQYLIIYYKNYSHRRVPAATVTMVTSTTRTDQRLRYYSASAHRARATVEYLRHATPDFISSEVWPPNSPNLSGQLQNMGLSSRRVRNIRGIRGLRYQISQGHRRAGASRELARSYAAWRFQVAYSKSAASVTVVSATLALPVFGLIMH